jgi:Putative porin
MRLGSLKRVIAVLSVAILFFAMQQARADGPGARADNSNAILDLLERKGVITHEEAERTRQEYDQQIKQTVVQDSKTKVASWVDQLKWYGDFRLRAEYFNFEQDPKTGVNLQDDRLRYRVRLRLGVEAKLQDWADVGARIGTGDSGDPYNSVSQNSTLSDTFRKKPVNLDLAYATIHPPAWDWLQVTGGKMLVPTWHPVTLSPMIYDPDVTPEGVAEKLSWKLGDQKRFRLFANFGEFALKEFSKDENDVYLFDFQGGVEAKFDRVKATIGGGYYMTQNVNLEQATPSPGTGAPAGTIPGNASTADSANTGNSVIVIGGKTNYLGNFLVFYGQGELAWTIADQPLLGTPSVLAVGGEYLKNTDRAYEHVSAINPDNQTEGWAVQGTFGKAEAAGQWLVGYEYKRLEANATFDAIVDDDFGSFGGTDRKGHVVNAVYNVKDWWQLGFKAFITDKINGLRTGTHSQPGFAGQDSLRVQADTLFKF